MTSHITPYMTRTQCHTLIRDQIDFVLSDLPGNSEMSSLSEALYLIK